MSSATSAPHVVIVGGAYAGLSALNSLVSLSAGKGHPEGKKRGGPPRGGAGRGGGPPPGPPVEPQAPPPRALHTKPRYTLVDERDGFYHTVGAPLGQISVPMAKEFWVKYEEIIATKRKEHIDFVQGSVAGLDMESKTITCTSANAEAQRISYDYLILASGMSRKWPVVPTSLDFDSYVKDVEKWENELSQYKKIVCVGGGACGIEMSAELKVHFPDKEIVLIQSRNELLTNEPLSDEFKSVALKLLKEQGVDVRLNTRLLKDGAGTSGSSRSLALSTGETLEADKVIYTAVQQGANAKFVPDSLKEEKWGCVKVRDTFQFDTDLPNADVHYAVGDVAHWPSTIKRSGPAQNQAKSAAWNIVAQLTALEDGKTLADAQLAKTAPSKPTMTLAVGDQAIGMRMGLRYGREVKMGAFGTGLGIDGTLASLGLRPRRPQEVPHATGVLEDPKERASNI